MKTVIVYYSYTGKTRSLAEEQAKMEQAELVEIKERNARSTVGAYVAGSFAAMTHKKADIEPVSCDFSGFERIVVMVPLWAGSPAPAFNNILELLPNGCKIELVITSGSGNSSGNKDKTIALCSAKDIEVVKYLDVKTAPDAN